MAVTYRDGISILKLVVYAPYLLATIYVCCRHGFTKSSGWIFLTIFCVVRIISASSQLATINNTNPKTAYTVAAVTDSIGLSPLLLASLGLISRAYFSLLKPAWGMLFSITVLRIPQILVTVGAILCIIAATDASTPAELEYESDLHVGIVLYLASLIVLSVLTLIVGIAYLKEHRGEGRIILAVACSLPLILVRIIYSMVAAFAHNSSFNLISGSVTIMLFMVVLAEMAVVAIYTIVGLKTHDVPQQDRSSSGGRNLFYRASRGDFNTGRLGLVGLAFAAASNLKTREKDHADGNNLNGRPMEAV